MVLGDEKVPLYLYAMNEPPPVAHPLVAEGRWLEPANPDEIVLDFSLAKFYDFQVGDTVTILGADGNRELKIVGLAVTAHWFPYNEITKDTSPGVGYVSQTTLEALQPDSNTWFSVIGAAVEGSRNQQRNDRSGLRVTPRQIAFGDRMEIRKRERYPGKYTQRHVHGVVQHFGAGRGGDDHLQHHRRAGAQPVPGNRPAQSGRFHPAPGDPALFGRASGHRTGRRGSWGLCLVWHSHRGWSARWQKI